MQYRGYKARWSKRNSPGLKSRDLVLVPDISVNNICVLSQKKVIWYQWAPGSSTIGVSLVAQTIKNICLHCRRPRFDTWVEKIPWRREWQPTLAVLLGESHGQRSLEGYSPWGCKELDMTEHPQL